jgi:hypothetical protein
MPTLLLQVVLTWAVVFSVGLVLYINPTRLGLLEFQLSFSPEQGDRILKGWEAQGVFPIAPFVLGMDALLIYLYTLYIREQLPLLGAWVAGFDCLENLSTLIYLFLLTLRAHSLWQLFVAILTGGLTLVKWVGFAIVIGYFVRNAWLRRGSTQDLEPVGITLFVNK